MIGGIDAHCNTTNGNGVAGLHFMHFYLHAYPGPKIGMMVKAIVLIVIKHGK